MKSLRPVLLCTSVLTLSTILAGCDAGSRPSFAGGGSGIAAPSSATTPTVTSVAVQVNGTAPNRLQEVQFSEPMNPATLNTQTFQITDASGKAVPGVVSYDANYYVASFQPTPALKPNANYTATLTTGVASAQGAHLASNYTYAIKTRKMTDNSPIYVTATNPGMDATCVNTSSPVMVTFSEEPAANTLTAKNIFLSSQNGSILPTTLGIEINTTVVTLTPVAPLPMGNITVTVSRVGDLADRLMAKPYVSTFSTMCGGTGGGPGGGNTGGSGNNGGPGSGGASQSNSAYVYVAIPELSAATPRPSQIYEFASASSGMLTPVPGSPYTAANEPYSLAAGGMHLFATLVATGEVETYSIASNGALAPAATTNTQKYDTAPISGGTRKLFLDNSHATLYGNVSSSTVGGALGYQAFSIQPNGSLNFAGETNYSDPNGDAKKLSFTANNNYGYGSDSTGGYAKFYGFVRHANGSLTYFDPKANLPAPPSPNRAGVQYYPYGAAASSNYVVIALQLGIDQGYQSVDQLAVYAIGSNGTLSTTNTAATMPKLTTGSATSYHFDPTGTYLAVGGGGGLEIFALRNGNLTRTGIVPAASVSQLAWDNAGHLYTYDQFGGQIYVYNVTNGVPSLAAGSPVNVPIYGRLAVQPLY